MPKFSVSVNDSSRYVVSAKGTIGAVKAALEAIGSDEPSTLDADVLEITVARLTPREAPVPEVIS